MVVPEVGPAPPAGAGEGAVPPAVGSPPLAAVSAVAAGADLAEVSLPAPGTAAGIGLHRLRLLPDPGIDVVLSMAAATDRHVGLAA